MIMNQKFGEGDIVTDGKFVMKVILPIQDEDGSWWYECESVGWESPFRREIPQQSLAEYKFEIR